MVQIQRVQGTGTGTLYRVHSTDTVYYLSAGGEEEPDILETEELGEGRPLVHLDSHCQLCRGGTTPCLVPR